MTEAAERENEIQSIEKILQSSSGKEFIGVKEEKSLLVTGFSANNVKEYKVRLADAGEMNIFAKFFRYGGSLEARQDRLAKELACVEKISEISPNSTYEVAGYDHGNPVLLTKTIEGCIPLSIFLTKSSEDVKTRLLKGGIRLLNLLHMAGIVHGDAQLRNFGIVIGEALREDEGIKVFDFEDAVFNKEVSPEQFKRMIGDDIVKFFLSGLLIGKAVDAETIDQNRQLKKYYQSKKDEFVSFLGGLYSPDQAQEIWAKLSKRLNSEIYD